MTRLVWDGRDYDSGVDRGVLYLESGLGVPWNGLVSVREKADDISTRVLYFDGEQYTITQSYEDFSATLEAFMYPDEFEPYDGLSDIQDGQRRKQFGLSYRSETKLHLVYNAIAAPSDKNWATRAGSPSISPFSWDLMTSAELAPNVRPTSHLVIDLNRANPTVIAALEAVIYGDSFDDPVLPDPFMIADLFEDNSTLRVTDNGDGTWQAVGPSTMITMINPTTFQINTPSAAYYDSDMYQLGSY